MRMSPRIIRAGIVISLALPVFVVLMSSTLQAQFPQPPRPPIVRPPGPTKIERVWTCGKCLKEIGRGAFPPGTCPFCGVKIINGIGGGSPSPNNPNPFSNPNPMPPPGPMPPPNAQPNGGVKDLAGSSWQGNETLAGYGALTFVFNPNGQANMIDKDGNTPGSWNRSGNNISLNFGGVVYTGTINGGQMSGSARDNKNSWSWNVSNNQFNTSAPPINQQPMPLPVTAPQPMPLPVSTPAPIPQSQPNNPQPINPQPAASPAPQPNSPQPPLAVQPPPPSTQPNVKTPAQPPVANTDVAEAPRARSGVITIIVGVVFLCIGLAVVGGGVFFIVKSMK